MCAANNSDRPGGRSFTRRALLGPVFAAPLALVACSDVPHTRVYVDLLKARLKNRPPRNVPRSEVAKYAAASIQMQLGRGPAGLILLHSIQGKDLVWLSPDRILLVTRSGRLTQTGGLRRNLDATHFETSDPVNEGLLSSDGKSCARLLSYQEHERARDTQIEALSRFELAGPATLDILGVPTQTIHVREHVHVREVVWRHRNDYWADAKTGMVWKSRQHIYPDYPPVTITTLRPVAS